jgi:ABC-type maltose transport system permease subunit
VLPPSLLARLTAIPSHHLMLFLDFDGTLAPMPVVLLSALFQRHTVAGLTAGSVKG